MIKQVKILVLIALSMNIASAQIDAPYVEVFDDITTLTDWTFVNNSDIPGSRDFFQGNSIVFSANSGASTAYLAANFNSTAGTVISSWAISPEFSFCEGATITYFTRTVDGSTFPDGSELRISLSGASEDVGTSPTSVGDFTVQAVDVNTSLTTGGYPEAWTQFTYTYSGPPVTGRAALRYVVSTSAGPTGANSNYIGFDDFEFTPGLCDVEVVPTMGEWGLISLGILLMIFGVVAVSRRTSTLKLD